MVPVHTLKERMGHVTVAKELTDPTQKMLLVCPELHLLENHVHILVDFPPSHGEPILVVLCPLSLTVLHLSPDGPLSRHLPLNFMLSHDSNSPSSLVTLVVPFRCFFPAYLRLHIHLNKGKQNFQLHALTTNFADADEPPTKRRRQNEEVIEEGMCI